MKLTWSHGPLAFLCVSCLAGCDDSTSTPPPATKPLPKLAVSATDIVRADTQAAVTLRGVVFSAGVWLDVPFGSAQGDLRNLGFMQSEADFQRIASWGANLAILYLNYRWFADANGYAFVDSVLAWCRTHGVYLLPSLVVYPGGGQRGGAAFFGSSDLENQAKQFWVDFATRYRDHTEIAGYDLLNEPQGADPTTIAAYQTTLVDAVRAVDPNAILFIEPQWGVAWNFVKIDRPGLVYDAHFYEPVYFTSQRFPWMYGGAIPGGVHYPNTDGSLVTNIVVPYATEVFDTSVPGGTYDFQTKDTSYPIPAGADLAYVKLFSNGDSGATLYFDNIRASVDGAPYELIPNGSFEVQNETSTDANYWTSYVATTGTAERTNSYAADGQYSARIAKSGAWSDYTTHYGTDASDQSVFFVGTESGVPVQGASTLALRWMVRAENATPGKNGLNVMFANVQKQSYGNAELTDALDSALAMPSRNFGAPMLIGEFAASLIGPRPDIMTWVSDVIAYANNHGFSWAYYQYRDDWTGQKYMGLYNAPYGVMTTPDMGDADMLATVKAGF